MSEVCNLSLDNEHEEFSSDSLENLVGKPSVSHISVPEILPKNTEKPFRLHDDDHNAELPFLFPRKNEQPEEPVAKSVECKKLSMSRENDFSLNLEFPEIQTLEKFKSSPFNSPVEDDVLNPKSLQRNTDGSFSKSPQRKYSDLPFVAQQFKNGNFPRRRKILPKIKTDQGQKKSLPKCGETQIAKKNEMLTKSEKTTFATSENLTDSMKEELLKSCLNKIPRQPNNKMKNRNISARKNEKNCLEKLPVRLQQMTIKERSKIFTKTNHLREQQPSENVKTNTISKSQKSDQVLAKLRGRQRLTYTERLQQKRGFNPMSLHGCNKNAPEDTNRSIFGDSGLERVSDVPSPDCQQVDDDEDAFYQKLMAGGKEKNYETEERSEVRKSEAGSAFKQEVT